MAYTRHKMLITSRNMLLWYTLFKTHPPGQSGATADRKKIDF